LIRKSSIRRITEAKVNKTIALYLEPKGYTYIKTQSEYRRKVGDYENVFSTQIPFDAIRYDKDESNYILWFELYSYLRIPKFDKWFKKNTKNEIRVYSRTKRFEGYIRLADSDLNEEDFFNPSESRQFKHDMLGDLIGERGNINDYNAFDLHEAGEKLLAKEAELLENKSNLESFLEIEKSIAFNRFHVYFLDITPYLYVFNQNLEMAEKYFNKNYNKYVSMFPDLRKEYSETDYFFDFFESFIDDAKKFVGIEYPNNIAALKETIK